MKTLGLIGGTGWISTVEYYRLINEETNRRLGGLEAARLVVKGSRLELLQSVQPTVAPGPTGRGEVW